MNKRSQILNLIEQERERQNSLPGSELDGLNSPNDWISIVCHYVTEHARRKSTKSVREDYEDSLTKAAAVILAALEHCDRMDENDQFE